MTAASSLTPALTPQAGEGDAALNRLRWRCQRGMLELDHILAGFLDGAYAVAAPGLRRAFEALLALEDADLFDLVMGRAPASSAEQAELIAVLRRQD